MKVVPDSCTLKSQPSDDGSVVVHANFTMRPDPNMDSIIGQTAHNLDEVSISCLTDHDPVPAFVLLGSSENSCLYLETLWQESGPETRTTCQGSACAASCISGPCINVRSLSCICWRRC